MVVSALSKKGHISFIKYLLKYFRSKWSKLMRYSKFKIGKNDLLDFFFLLKKIILLSFRAEIIQIGYLAILRLKAMIII